MDQNQHIHDYFEVFATNSKGGVCWHYDASLMTGEIVVIVDNIIF